MLFPKSARKTAPTLFTWFIATVTLMFASQVLANGKVYQVEVIIFERGAQQASGDVEGWQKNVLLEYPKNWLQLVDPDEEAARQAQADKEGSLRLSDDFLQTLAEERENDNQNAPSSIAADQSSAPVGPRYFEYLPEENLNLRKTRDALTRRNHYRVLFHETWLQPMSAPEKSPALILHGGKRYGDHFELQGYINISVSRFLHIQTDLWLSEFSVNHGQDIGHWPQLPLEPHLSMPRTSTDPTDAQHQPRDADMVNLTPPGTLSNWGSDAEYWQEDIAEPPYLVNQISTLRQKRRMRSGEVHYLDHPKLGILIKITPQENAGG